MYEHEEYYGAPDRTGVTIVMHEDGTVEYITHRYEDKEE